MRTLTHKELLDAGVHFGHLSRKWNPKMAPYIFMESKGIHIIDLNKTIRQLEQTALQMKAIAASGKKILFVATKKQAKEVVRTSADKVGMPHVTERWYGGMLTNFATIRKSIKKMDTYEKMQKDGSFESLTKKERLMLTRENDKLDMILGGIAQLNRLPAAIFVVDMVKEHIAIAEASKLNIPTFAIVDTNANPDLVDSAIPANDDASKAIAVIMEYLSDAIQEGLAERNKAKEAKKDEVKEEEKVEAVSDNGSVEPVAEAKAEETAVEVKEAKKVEKKKVPAKKTAVKKITTDKKPAAKKTTEAKKDTTAKKPVAKKTTAKKAASTK